MPQRGDICTAGKAGSREAQGRLQEQLVPGHCIRKGFERGREAYWWIKDSMDRDLSVLGSCRTTYRKLQWGPS